jgi:hypothetical protein
VLRVEPKGSDKHISTCTLRVYRRITHRNGCIFKSVAWPGTQMDYEVTPRCTCGAFRREGVSELIDERNEWNNSRAKGYEIIRKIGCN